MERPSRGRRGYPLPALAPRGVHGAGAAAVQRDARAEHPSGVARRSRGPGRRRAGAPSWSATCRPWRRGWIRWWAPAASAFRWPGTTHGGGTHAGRGSRVAGDRRPFQRAGCGDGAGAVGSAGSCERYGDMPGCLASPRRATPPNHIVVRRKASIEAQGTLAFLLETCAEMRTLWHDADEPCVVEQPQRRCRAPGPQLQREIPQREISRHVHLGWA